MYHIDNIEITENPIHPDYPPYVLDKIEEFHTKIIHEKPNNKIVIDLKKLIKQFPNIPTFSNYLMNAYYMLGKKENGNKILDYTIKTHPDYIFAISKKVEQLAKEDKIDQAKALLRHCNNINEFYPDKTLFHITEIKAFYSAAFFIEAADFNNKHANQIIDLLETLDKDLSKNLSIELMGFSLKKMSLSKQDRITPKLKKLISTTNITELPILQNDIINKFFSEKISISSAEAILKLDRATAISDLVKILESLARRHDQIITNEEEFSESCVIDILILLKALQAEEALEPILNCLKYEYEFMDYSLGDFKTESLWQVFFVIAQNKINHLAEFLKQPGIDAYDKSAVSSALTQLYLHVPKKQKDIEQLWVDLLKYYNSITLESNIVDTTFFAFFISDIIPSNNPIFLEEIKKLYDKGWIDKTVCGNYESFKTDNYAETKQNIQSTEELLNMWDYDESYSPYDFSDEELSKPYFHQQPFKNETNKIGRNEPCPCGSGKKHKKCCL